MRRFHRNFFGTKNRFVLIVCFVLIPQLSQAETCRGPLERISKAFRERGFTVTELLVSVAVIGTLIAITVPALSKSRNAARNVKCLSNLHQALVATQVYENNYKVLPVHTIDNNPSNPTATVNLRTALEIDEGTIKAWQCPEDKGFADPTNGEIYFHSYLYRGLEAMLSRQPPFQFYPPNAQRRYERDATKDLYYRLPLYHDVYGFHESRQGPPYYSDGQRNAAWWDGTVRRIPTERPPGPIPPP